MINYNGLMAINYTSIDDLVKSMTQPSAQGALSGKEVEPVIKKREAVGIAVDDAAVHEVVEHEVEPRLKPYIKPRKEIPTVSPDIAKLGVASTASTSFPSYKSVNLPLSDDRVFQGLHAPVTTSLRWLAELCLYLLKQAHLTLKNIHGKVVRVGVR